MNPQGRTSMLRNLTVEAYRAGRDAVSQGAIQSTSQPARQPASQAVNLAESELTDLVPSQVSLQALPGTPA
jgi:hypothetical protein